MDNSLFTLKVIECNATLLEANRRLIEVLARQEEHLRSQSAELEALHGTILSLCEAALPQAELAAADVDATLISS